MSKIIKVDNPVTPALLDEAFIAINTKLLTSVDWLDNAFGKVQKLERKNDRKKVIKYPAIYTGKGVDYKSTLPNEAYGNFSYWEAGDYDIEQLDRNNQVITAEVGLIVWMNISKVLGSDEKRNLESLKEQILLFFSGMNVIRVRLSIDEVTEKNDKIYKEYGLKEIESQYLMHPFAGLRFNGEIRYERWCNG